MVRELDLIRWLAARHPAIGDDCAVIDLAPWGTLLVTTDSVIDGVHAHWGEHGPGVFGYKAVARGLSDVAAMGEPIGAFLAASLPAGTSDEQARAVVLGAERAGCPLLGGDTACGPTAWVVGTVLGRAHAVRGPVLRSQARAGDWIVVSGSLGGAVDSGRHLDFVARVAEARALVERCDVGAMIDLSDGLASDLRHVVEASGVRARVESASIPLHAGATVAPAWTEGEDYELLATVRPGPLPAGFVRIGIVEAGAGIEVVEADGTARDAPGSGLRAWRVKS